MTLRRCRAACRWRWLLPLLLMVGAAATAGAATDADGWREVFPGAEHFGPPEGTPPVQPAFLGGELRGYVFSSKAVGGVGYGGRPLDLLVGLGLDCRITGVKLIEHREPILMLGLPDSALTGFARQYVGLDVARRVRLGAAAADGSGVQAISRATLSSLALNDAILGAARLVARGRRLPCMTDGAAAPLDLDAFVPESWDALRAAGSVAEMVVTAARATAALRQAGVPQPASAALPPDANFATLDTALATPAQIGANLLGRAAHARLLLDAPPGSSLIFVGGTGFQSFKGTAYARTGVFERIQILQGDRSIPLTAAQHHRVDRLRAAGAPELREAAVFLLPPETGFRPDQPWRLQFAVSESRPEGGPAYALFTLPYTLPARHILPASVDGPEAGAPDSVPPLWQRAWQGKPGRIAILGLALIALYAVFALQDQVARRARLWNGIRLATLLFTLGWLGWYAGAQLSILHVLAFLEALRTQFDWSGFLLGPLVFILWSWLTVALAFWGRGAFCGWLCPFGALQELLNRLARRLRVPQIAVPFALHERLWPLKYIAFFALFAISLGSMAAAIAGRRRNPSRPRSPCVSCDGGRSRSTRRCCWERDCSSSASSAGISAPWAARWRSPRGCGCSSG